MSSLASSFVSITPPISIKPPTEAEVLSTKNLESYMKERSDIYDSQEDKNMRSEILKSLNIILKDWAKSVGETKMIPLNILENGGGIHASLFGSCFLGVNTPDADIDVLCIAPSFITKVDFFSSFITYLGTKENVSMISAIPEAFTPVIKFYVEDQPIDMIFVSLSNVLSVPENIDILNDDYLIGLDEQGIRSFNGCRVAGHILRLVPNVSNFCTTLRAIKHWARQRGIYSNVLGFLGGVNYAILVAFICQRFPNACASVLVRNFFQVYSQWQWPRPIILCNIESTNCALKDNQSSHSSFPAVWNPIVNPRDRLHIMPIITPAFPAMNSAYNVGIPQLRLISEEIRRGLMLCQHSMDPWDTLFLHSTSDFFTRHPRYLQVDILSSISNNEHRSWFGWVESRMRFLFQSIENPPNVYLHPSANCFHRNWKINNTNDVIDKASESSSSFFPVSHKIDIPNQDTYSNTKANDSESNEVSIPCETTSLNINMQNEDTTCFSSTYFLGLSFKQGLKTVDLKCALDEFKFRLLQMMGRKTSMDISISICPQKSIPSFVFNTISEPSNVKSCTPIKLNPGVGSKFSPYGLKSPLPVINDSFESTSETKIGNIKAPGIEPNNSPTDCAKFSDSSKRTAAVADVGQHRSPASAVSTSDICANSHSKNYRVNLSDTFNREAQFDSFDERAITESISKQSDTEGLVDLKVLSLCNKAIHSDNTSSNPEISKSTNNGFIDNDNSVRNKHAHSKNKSENFTKSPVIASKNAIKTFSEQRSTSSISNGSQVLSSITTERNLERFSNTKGTTKNNANNTTSVTASPTVYSFAKVCSSQESQFPDQNNPKSINNNNTYNDKYTIRGLNGKNNKYSSNKIDNIADQQLFEKSSLNTNKVPSDSYSSKVSNNKM